MTISKIGMPKPTKPAPTSTEACPPGALPGGPCRTRFFDGMFLTQADLENEQRYWLLKRRLTNRALGSGVVWGLRVRWDPQTRSFSLSPGYAIDCCGNDLVVECPVTISESDLASAADPSSGLGTGPVLKPLESARTIASRQACLVLQYVECPEDGRAVYADACTGIAGTCQPARVRESTRLMLAPPPSRERTPPEEFLADLADWKAGLSDAARNRIFGAQSSPAPAPDSGDLPFQVAVTVPDAPAQSGSVRPNTDNVQTTGPIGPVTQTSGAEQRTAVIELELQPDAGYGFFAGTIEDQGRTVERIDPPVARSMFWSIDIDVTKDKAYEGQYVFDANNLGYEEMFGHNTGRANLTITVDVQVTVEASDKLSVLVTSLAVKVENATLAVDGAERARCLDELLTAWALDPAHAGDLAKALVLSATYAYLAEATAGGTQSQVMLAQLIYTVAWLLLFGANLEVATAKEQRELASLLQKLFQAWCASFLYPGPRCRDDHHGVYLGCLTVGEDGTLSSFDPWENRRYVVTGALLGYWAGQLGLAPIDLVVGRLASALCCISDLPVPQLELGDVGAVGNVRLDMSRQAFGPAALLSSFTFGSRKQVQENTKRLGAQATRSVSWGEMVARTVALFTGAGAPGPREALTFDVPGGASIGVMVPALRTAPAGGAIAAEVDRTLASGEVKVSAGARAPLSDFVVALANSVPVSAVVGDAASPAVRKLAKRLDDAKISAGGLIARDPEEVLATLAPAPADREPLRVPLDEIYAAAESATRDLTVAAAKATPAGFSRSKLTEAKFLKPVRAAVAGKFGKQVDAKLVDAAAKAARGTT